MEDYINPTKKLLAMMADKSALAKMDAFDLSEKLNRAVRNAFAFANTMDTEAKSAANEAARLAEIVARTDNGEKRAELAAQYEAAKQHELRAVALRDESFRDFDAYIEEQKRLFSSKGLPPERAYKDMIVPVGEMKRADGSTLQLMKIVKRTQDFMPVDTEENEHALSVAASRSYSDGVGIARDQKRGKYNDAHQLINQEAANIDRSEYADWTVM